ncbi:hypothetical protein E2562_018635 [Oryza meyeriana var. granulata]|uniref:Uncharacterized protein n=1 Tax=Oryza meyeriana var. granulata TaxID=110450 RepID=A0A6G1BYW6_9ORYZ|nr:hypothetical protein E2562_018635 [Oryza meyeriana var. granulata]
MAVVYIEGAEGISRAADSGEGGCIVADLAHGGCGERWHASVDAVNWARLSLAAKMAAKERAGRGC